ncbi:unnamed protein product, partial [Choristocarpus tenellus]
GGDKHKAGDEDEGGNGVPDREDTGEGGSVGSVPGSEEEQNGHGGWNAGVCCTECNPPPTSRYSCPKCSITHMGECAYAEIIDDERHKDRLCINCPMAQEGSEGSGSMG